MLAADDGAAEILVERVKPQRGAEAQGEHAKVCVMINGG